MNRLDEINCAYPRNELKAGKYIEFSRVEVQRRFYPWKEKNGITMIKRHSPSFCVHTG